jgi:hypothetical protein
LVRGKDSETQIKQFYEFERRNKLDCSAVVGECCYAIEKRLSANQGGGDDANVIFGGASVKMFRIGHRARLQREYTNIKTRSDFLIP